MDTEALGRMRPKSRSRRSSSSASPWKFFGSSSKSEKQSEDNDGMSVGTIGSMSTIRSSSSKKSNKPSSKRGLCGGRSSSASISRGSGSDLSSKQQQQQQQASSSSRRNSSQRRTNEDSDTNSLLSSQNNNSGTHEHETKKIATSHTHMRSASTSRVTVVRSVSNSKPKEEDDFFPTPRKITPGKKRPPPGLAEQPSYRWGAFPVSRPKSTSRGRAGSSRGRATATPPPERNTKTPAPAASPRSSSRRQQRKQSLDLSPLPMTGSSTQKSKNNTKNHTRTPSTGASTTNSSSAGVPVFRPSASASSEQRIQQAVANLPKRKLDFDTSILDSLAQIEANIERDPKARDSAAVQRRKMAAAGSTSFTTYKGKRLLIPYQNIKPQKKKGLPTNADTLARLTKAATSLDALGNSHYERGEYAKAMDAYNKALKIKRRLVQEEGKESLFVTKTGGSGEKESLLSIATSLNNIGYCRQHLSRPTVKSSASKATGTGSDVSDAKSSQRKKKEQEDAMSVYTESLNLKIQALGRDNVSVAKTRNNIGRYVPYYMSSAKQKE
jgi:tetratricopeptide (TPR) repeat protein